MIMGSAIVSFSRSAPPCGMSAQNNPPVVGPRTSPCEKKGTSTRRQINLHRAIVWNLELVSFISVPQGNFSSFRQSLWCRGGDVVGPQFHRRSLAKATLQTCTRSKCKPFLRTNLFVLLCCFLSCARCRLKKLLRQHAHATAINTTAARRTPHTLSPTMTSSVLAITTRNVRLLPGRG